jgi:hypothetical protein
VIQVTFLRVPRAALARSKRVKSSTADADDPTLRVKIITGELCARPLRSQCCYLRREPGSYRLRCIADSGFDTQSDLLLAILTFP